MTGQPIVNGSSTPRYLRLATWAIRAINRKRHFQDSWESSSVIVVDGRYLHRPGVGIHIFLRALLDMLAQLPVRVHVVSDLPSPSDFEIANATWHCIPRGRLPMLLWEQTAMPLLVRRLGADVLVLPANTGVPAFCRVRRRILVMHDVIPWLFWRTYCPPGKLIGPLFAFASSLGFLRATHILSVSSSTAEDVQRIFARSSAVCGQPMASLALPSPASDLERDPIVVYNGGFDPRKRVGLALAGFALFRQSNPEYRLALVGSPGPQIMEQIDRLGLRPYVDAYGRVDDNVKNDLVSRSRAVLYPSLYEGFGMPILEGLAGRTPVVCGSGGAQSHLVGGAGHVLVTGFPSEVAEALGRVTDAKFRHSNERVAEQQLYALANEFSMAEVLKSALGLAGGH